MARFQIQASTLLAYILVMLFGSSAWISVNSAWIQLPLMVTVLPEGWNLPSYLAIIVQLAFIGPLIYAIAKKLLPYVATRNPRLSSVVSSNLAKNCSPTPLIYGTLIVAVLCHLLLAIFWQRTTIWPNGQNHSTTLFILFFFMSLVNSLSNVLYLPYMFRFQSSFITAYFIGMGFSALVPSVLGLIQGSGRIDCVRVPAPNSTIGNETVVEARPVLPAFGVGVFNGIICIWLAFVIIGFYFLNRLPQIGGTERSAKIDCDETEDESKGKSAGNSLTAPDEIDVHHETSIPTPEIDRPLNESMELAADKPRTDTLSPLSYLYLLIATAWVCALMNGVLPSIQSFATLPYGQLIYHLAVTISSLANPVACFVPFFLQVRRINLVVTVWAAIATLLSAYILMAASWSPKALLGLGSGSVGPAFSVISWTLVTGILAYLRTIIAGALRESGGGGAQSENRLFWCGLFTQAGAFIGAIIMFPLINYRQVFQSAPSCPDS